MGPEAWLWRVPVGVLRAYAAMMAPLVAEESLLTQTRVAVGTGAMKTDDAKKILTKWRRDARGVQARAVRTSPRALGQFGIGYRHVARRLAVTL